MTMQMLLARRRMMMQAATPSDTYLTFTANTAGSTIAMVTFGSAPSVSLEYSTDGGVTWQTFTVGSTTVTLANVGDKVKMRGNNNNLGIGNAGHRFVMTGGVAASGDLTSLLNGVGGDVAVIANGFRNLFYLCSALTSAPNLPSTSVAARGYLNLFRDCTGLVSSPYLLAASQATDAYNDMFNGCTGITSHHVATLPASTNVYNNNTACASFRIDAITPPTIASSTITGLKSGCVIYVPAASVEAYKAAPYWSARAAYIQAIP